MNIGKLLGTVIGTGEQILSVATGNGGSLAVPVAGDKVVAVSVSGPAELEGLREIIGAIERGDKAAVMQFLYPELPGKMLHLTLDLADGVTAEVRKDGVCDGNDFVRVAMRVAAGAM